jgi:serine/threonine-protein kinase
VSGGNLQEWIRTGRLNKNLPLVLRLALQFCDGMLHLAAGGIKVHRDIKPQNCLLTEDATLKITDFGLAKALEESYSSSQAQTEAVSRCEVAPEEATVDMCTASFVLTRTGMMAGTPAYMAPEQFLDAKRVDVRADVYSFGVMLYEMITGRLPFTGTTWSQLKQLHQSAPVPVLENPHLARIINNCLAKNPKDRFSNFHEISEELLSVCEQIAPGLPASPFYVSTAVRDAAYWFNQGRTCSNWDTLTTP